MPSTTPGIVTPGITPRFTQASEAAVRAVPVAEGAAPPKAGRAARAGFGPRAGQVAEVLTQKRRLLLVRCDADLEAAGAVAAARLGAVARIAIDARRWSPADAARFAAGAVLRAWRFDRLRTRPDPERPALSAIDVLVNDPAAAEAAWAALGPGVRGALFARDLVVEPGNALTPAGFAARLSMLERHGVEVEVLDAKQLLAEGFGGLLAVGGGSAHPPCLVALRWAAKAGDGAEDGAEGGAKNRAKDGGGDGRGPVLLVGKGITFDTGGLCIKPADGMWEMRADMAGAAACAGAMLALALRRSPVPVVALLALAENAVGARSYRPGDVLRMRGGLTVEVVDTDAEGRLVLADALAWGVATVRPRLVIDLGTLTGSIVTALGHDRAGLFATDDGLAAAVAAAGTAVGERTWRMPLHPGYGEALDSEVADIRQCADGGRQPDACHAAHFLHRFVADAHWAHLDIAGVESHEAASDRHTAGPTGWGARLLDRLVRDCFEAGHREA